MGKPRGGHWARVEAWLPSHRKSRKLGRELGDPRAWTYVVALWLWSIREAVGDDLSRVEPEDIAAGCEWKGEPERLIDALVAAEFLDRDATGLRIHEWPLYNGRHVEQLVADRESAKVRMRTARALARIGRQEPEGAPSEGSQRERSGAPDPAGAPALSPGAPDLPIEEGLTEGSPPCSPERAPTCSGERSHAGAPYRPVSSRLVGGVRGGAAAPNDPDEAAELTKFSRWWLAYPEPARRLSSRTRAWREWQLLATMLPPMEELLWRLEAQAATPSWREKAGHYVPRAENYLRDLRWAEPVERPAPTVGGEPLRAERRIEGLVRNLPPELVDRSRVVALMRDAAALAPDFNEVEKRLATIERELLDAEQGRLSADEAAVLWARARAAVAHASALPEHQARDTERRVFRRALRELRGLPILSLWSAAALAAEEDAVA